MRNAIFCLFYFFFIAESFAQNVGINTPTPTSSLDINGGLRLRQLLTPVTGASVMLTSNRAHHVLSGTGTGDFTIAFTDATLEGQQVIITNNTLYKGFLVPIYIQPNTTVELIYSSAAWKLIGSNEAASRSTWSLTGNTLTNGFLNFIGTTNNEPLLFKINGADAGGVGRNQNVTLGDGRNNNFFNSVYNVYEGPIANTAIGYGSLKNDGIMYGNTAIGAGALSLNTTGNYNAAMGWNSLVNNKTGDYAVAIGFNALASDTLAYEGVAIGSQALTWNNGRRGNTAVGAKSLFHNSKTDFGILTSKEGIANTAFGYNALFSNRKGSGAVAIGFNAAESDTKADGIIAIGRATLYNNNNRTGNVAVGDSALYSNGPGATTSLHAVSNTAIGNKALLENTIGGNNTAVGDKALLSNTTGDANTAIGSSALSLSNGKWNTAIGYNVLLRNAGQDNVAIGISALISNISGSGNVALGSRAGFNELSSNKLYIENTSGNKDNALIYGDFAADSLLLNAKTINKFSLNVRGNYPLEIGYGTSGKQVDAGKLCYGCFGDPEHWLGIVGGGTAALGGDRVIKLWSEGGLRIKGNALPNTDNGHSLGQSGLRWSSVWAVSGVINSSDATLKTNISNSPYGLEEVMQMNPVQYNWKTNPNEDLQIGFLAQDIQKIIPEAVVVPANGDPLGMKYTELIPVLVKAIQELRNEITELKKQLNK